MIPFLLHEFMICFPIPHVSVVTLRGKVFPQWNIACPSLLFFFSVFKPPSRKKTVEIMISIFFNWTFPTNPCIADLS